MMIYRSLEKHLSLRIKTVFTFIYYLSGNEKVAVMISSNNT